jgi:hypothetical protein
MQKGFFSKNLEIKKNINDQKTVLIEKYFKAVKTLEKKIKRAEKLLNEKDKISSKSLETLNVRIKLSKSSVENFKAEEKIIEDIPMEKLQSMYDYQMKQNETTQIVIEQVTTEISKTSEDSYVAFYKEDYEKHCNNLEYTLKDIDRMLSNPIISGSLTGQNRVFLLQLRAQVEKEIEMRKGDEYQQKHSEFEEFKQEIKGKKSNQRSNEEDEIDKIARKSFKDQKNR